MIRRCLLAGVFVVAAVTEVRAGPDHQESNPISPPGDPVANEAGSFSGTAQKVYKNCPPSLTTIAGELIKATTAGADDLEDMYRIRIVDPANFKASTSAGVCVDGSCGSTSPEFDTQLWLFRINGTGLLANDDCLEGSKDSCLVAVATDLTGVDLADYGAGEYFLAITAFNNDPVSPDGPIFFVDDLVDRTEVSGPDGPDPDADGTEPLIGWTGGPDSLLPGTVYMYQIVLEGAEGFTQGVCQEVPTVSGAGRAVLAVLLTALGLTVWRRHRQAAIAQP